MRESRFTHSVKQGKPLQIPGPLLRVPEGTEIRVTIRSRVSQRLYVRGLSSRGSAVSAADTLQIEPGTTREVTFAAGKPGTYFYRASTVPPTPAMLQPGIGSQLFGGFIIDPRGAARVKERIFLLSFWADSALAQLDGLSRTLRFAINGKAWPATERMQHSLGDSIRWRVINASSAVHPMHLHGFYYRVGSRGNESLDSIYPRDAAPHLVVTERLAPGRTMTMTWVSERLGNWLFHCHDNVHIMPNTPLPGATIAKAADGNHANHALQMMGGLVMGVEVRGRSSQNQAASIAPRRELRLVARTAEGGSAAEPSYGFVLHEGANPVNTTPRLPGPLIVLKRGEPVRIMVVNELPEQTAVHWHGIELESYYDGVPGFAGSSARLAPAIQPRDSFEVRFTPPRSGTFIYHTHVDEVRQQRAGLFGALIVVDPDKPYDPTTDIPILISTPRNVVDNAVVLVNGTATPAPLEMQPEHPIASASSTFIRSGPACAQNSSRVQVCSPGAPSPRMAPTCLPNGAQYGHRHSSLAMARPMISSSGPRRQVNSNSKCSRVPASC